MFPKCSLAAVEVAKDGYVDFNGFRTWYGIYGELKSGITPLLALHGGPGYPHNHIETLAELSEDGRPVIFYDQLGCGKSDRPKNPSMWSIALFLDELKTVRETLRLEHVDLLGTSWGGTLAIEYALEYPVGLRKLVLHSPLLDARLWVAENDKLKDLLPPDVAATMRRHELNGTTDLQEYHDAYAVFRRHFLCRAEPYPQGLIEAHAGAGSEVYETMWGPSEAYATGVLKTYSNVDRLGEISVPTLFISGEFDEATPAQMKLGHESVPLSIWVLLPECSHSANFERPDLYLAAISEFLNG